MTWPPKRTLAFPRGMMAEQMYCISSNTLLFLHHESILEMTHYHRSQSSPLTPYTAQLHHHRQRRILHSVSSSTRLESLLIDRMYLFVRLVCPKRERSDPC